MADRITSIYEKACAKGILDPQTQSEQWFRDQLSTEQGVKSFYDHATANGMKFHPYPEFKERLSQPVSSKPSSSAQPAGVSGGSLLDEQAELARQNAYQGATDNPNNPFVAPQTTQPIQGRELKMDEVVRPKGYENLTDEQLNEQIAQLSGNVHEQKARELYKARYGKDYVEPEEPTSWWDKYGYGQKGMQYRAEKQRYAEAVLDASLIAEQNDPGQAKRRNEQVATLRQEQAYRNQQEAMPKLGEEIKDLQQRILTNEKQDGMDMRGAKHLLNQTIDLYNAPSKYGRGKGVVNWGKGLADQITDYDTWTAGVTELARYGNLNGIVNKMNKNENLTKEEELLLETFLMSTAVQDMRSDLSTAYEIGKGAAESIPFMVEMYLTAGAGAAAKRGLVQLAERKVGQAFAEKLARSLGGTAIRDAAGHMVERGATRTVAGKVGKTLAYDFTQTAVMPSTYANIYKDRVSEVLQGDGNYGFMDLARSFTGQMVETGTERWGGRIIDRGMSKMIPIDATALWGKNKLFGHFVENYINSPIGETGEEVLAAGVNTLRSFNPFYSNVDEKSLSSNQRLRGELGEILSPEGLGKTFLTILPMSVFGGGANAAINRISANAVVKDYGQSRKALQGLLQSSGATAEEANRIVSQIEASDSDRTFFDKMSMTYNNLLNKYRSEHPNMRAEQDAYQQQLDQVLGNYTKQAGAYNQMVGDLMEKYEKLPEEEKRNVDSAMEDYMVRSAEELATKQQQPQDRQTQLRQQAAQQAQQEVQGMAHQDGNVYYVGIKGKDDAEGYAVSGNLNMQQDQQGMYSTSGRDLVTVKMNDGSVQQVPADELVVRDIPVSADELMQERTDHYFAQYANNDLFQIGDKVHIMQDGQPSEDSSTIVNITDEGVEVEIIDPYGQPNTTVIPHEQAAEMLSKAEGTEDGIVTFQMRDGNTVRLRDMGDGVYNTIVPEGELAEIFTEEELAEAGAVRAEEAPVGESNQTPQWLDTQTSMGNGNETPGVAPAYPTDEEGIVTFRLPDNRELHLRDMGNGTYQTIPEEEGEEPYRFTTAELQQLGAQKVEQAPVQPVQGQAPAAPVQHVQPAQPQIGSNAPGIDELSAEDFAAQTVEFMQSPKVAQGYLTAERAKVNAQLQQLEKEGVTEYNSAEEYRTKAQQLEQSKARLQAQLEKIDGAIAAINAQAEAAVARKNLNEAIRKRAAEFSKQLGANIVIFDSLEQIPESQAEARAMYQQAGDAVDGWYDPKTGDIYMNANAYDDIQRFEEKVFHEVVSHKGLDQLLGTTNYNALCDAVWNSMDEATRKKYMDYAKANNIAKNAKGYQRIAAKEYIAFLSESFAQLELNDQSAEANNIRSEWAKICDFLRELFKKIFGNVQITNEDLAQLIHASFVNMQRQAQGITEEQGETNGVEAIFKPIMNAVAQWQGQPLINGLDPKKIGLSALNPDYARNKIRQIQELLNKPEKTAEDVAAIDGILGELYGALNTLIGSRQGGNENNNAESLINDIALQIAKSGAISQELLDSYVNEFAAAHNEEVNYGYNGFDSYIGGNSMWMRSALDRESGNTHEAEIAEKKRRKEEAEAAAAARNKITDEQQAVIDQLSQESAVGTTFVDGKSTYTITGVAHENEDGDMVVPVHVEKNGKTRDFEEDAVVISNKMLKAKPAAPVKQETKEPEDHTAAEFLNEALTETAKGNVPANVTIDETTIRDEEDSVEMDARLLIDGKPSNLSVTIFDQSLGSRGGYDPANLVKYYPFDNADNWSWEKADVLVNFFNKGEHSGKASVLDESDAVYFTSLQAAMEFAEFVNSEAANSPEVRLALAEAETDPNPTEAQKKAENYKQGHVTLWGLPITIENPKGSIRRGTDANGKQWEQEMHHTYGKIRRTEGVDGDHIDVFIGPNLTSDKVFVVDQRNVDTGEFDEHKCMLGFDSLEDAQNGYLSNYEEGWQGMGTVTEVTMDEFKKWIDSSHRKTKPFAEYKSVKTEGAASTAMEEQQTPTDNRETSETPAEDLTPLEAAQKRKAAREEAKAAEQAAQTQGESEMLTRLRELQEGEDQQAPQDYLHTLTDEQLEVLDKEVNELWNKSRTENNLRDLNDQQIREQYPEAWKTLLMRNRVSAENSRRWDMQTTEESIANRKAHTESEELRRYYEYEFAYMRASASKGDVLKAVHDAEEYLAGLSYEELAKIYNEIVRLQSEHDVPWILSNAYRARSANMENEGVFDYGLNHQGEIPEGKANKPKINASDWTAKDDLRPVLQGVYHDPTGVGVVTNAHILMATPSLYDPAQEGKIVKKDGSTVDGKFPNWQGVVDQARRINKKEATVDWTAIRNFIAGIKAKMKEEGNPLKKDSLANIIIRMPDGQVIIFRLNMFIPFADAAAAVGANTLHYSPINGQTLAETGDSHLVIMPVDPESFRKNLDWGYKDNFYYDLQPKQDEPVSAETPKTESKPERKPKPTRKKAAPAEQTQAPVETDAEVIEAQKPKNTDKIEDVGEKIGGARKDIVQETVDRINVNGDTFAKIFPKFDYHKLIANGLEPRLAAGLKYVCEHAKKSYKIRKKRFGENNALEATRFMANYAKGYLLGDTSLDFTSEGWVFTAYGKRRYEFGIKLWESLREAMGNTMFDVDLSGYDCDVIQSEEERKAEAEEKGRTYRPSSSIYYRRNADGESVEFTPRYAINTPKGDKLFTAEEYDQAVQYFQDQVTSAINYQAANPFELAIYRKRGSDDCCVHAKIGGKWVELTPWGKEYGLKYRDEHRAELQAMAQRKAEELKEQRKNTRPEAKVELRLTRREDGTYGNQFQVKLGKEYVPIKDDIMPITDSYNYLREHREELTAKAQELLNAYLDEQEANRGWKPQLNIGGLRNRVGTDWRNGADVTAERFRTEFGFRGVEFGNYVTQKERQRLLNECFDALHDMAEILGVSPRALSLNGQLGFAIGARGGAGAKAHYEPGKNVINLTKKNGWGALAHEWWHAMDYYFGKREKERPATGGVFREDVRKQMQDAFAAVMNAINGSEYLKRSQALDAKTNKRYYAEDTELGARAFEDYIAKQLIERGQVNDFLSHHTSEEDWNGDISNYPYPIEKDGTALADAFQSFFDTVEEQEDASTGNSVLFSVTDKKYAQFALTQANNPMLDDVHTGIRTVEDIHTLEETLNDDKLLVTEPDWEEEDIRRAIEDNQVTIYSSKPIQDGTFVTPSRMVAEDYAGGEMVYEKTVSPDKVAWIASDEGQYADVDHYDGNILFSITNANNEIFYSNAERAVEGIKQDKATPEQWRAMIEKAGGLKAGEDKWIGLGDWLAQQRPTIESHPDETPLQFAQRAQAERKKFTISKQEILHYIRANKIQIEETEYGEASPETSPRFRAFQNEVTEMWENVNRMQNGRFNEANQDIIRFEDDMQAKYGDDWRDLMDDSERNVANYLQERRDEINMEVFLPEEVVMEEMCNRHGDDFQLAFSIDDDGSLSIANEDAAGYYLDVNPINDTRLQYTTDGLTNKHEIAMTVPTIEAWNETDEIHFGDAGEGRAIAWVRFGDAKTISKPEELAQAEQEYKEFSRKMIGQYGLTYTERVMSDSERQQESDLIAKLNQARKDHPQVEGKVLVIDEIQSKRHQEGREHGYVDSETAIKYRQLEKETSKAQLEYHDYRDQLWKKYENQVRTRGEMLDVLTPEEKSKHTELQEKYENLYDRWEEFKKNIPVSAIPAAPFEKNWHELAMKRILRFAAENGYDKVAWTTGDQQAARYNIGEVIDSITRNEDEDYPYSYSVMSKDHGELEYDFDENGIYHDDGDPELDGKSMSDVFGKELAKRLQEMPAGETIDNEGLRIGGEGMRGFYDDMLPRFMQKYGKKWGATVGTVTMPQLEDGYQTMHAIDINDAMRVSVLEGQPMFSISPKAERIEKLRKSESAQISGTEFELPENDLKQAKKNAIEYGKKLQGYYVNKDTGREIQLQRGRHNGGVNEVLQHNYKDIPHLQSVAAIPQIIEKSIFIDNIPNRDKQKNPTVESYDHFVCGLKIGDVDYTVHALVAVDTRGVRYYDHNLIQIEKTKLLDEIQQATSNRDFGATPDTKSTISKFDRKVSELFSILQINPQENAENLQNSSENAQTDPLARWEAENPKPKAKEGEPTIDYAKRLQEWNNEHRKVKDAIKDAQPSYDHAEYDGVLFSTTPPFTGESIGDVAASARQRSDLNRKRRESAAITDMLIQLSKDNYWRMQEALHKINADIRALRKAAAMQADLDRSQVEALLDLTNQLIQVQWGGGSDNPAYQPQTMATIIQQVRNAIGKADISEEVGKIEDYLVHAQRVAAKNQWDKLRRTPFEKLNISGVVTQGKVAIQGQHALKALNEALNSRMTVEQLEEEISLLYQKIDEATDESLRTQYTGRMIGYETARQHLERLEELMQERQQLRNELEASRTKKELSPAARRELEASIKETLRDNNLRQAEAYTQSVRDLQEYVSGQTDIAKNFIEQQRQRTEMIRGYAAKDLEGASADPHRTNEKQSGWRKIWDAFASPIRDLQSLLRLTGLHAPDGEGYLYNHFMRNWTDAADKERQGIVAAQKTLDAKISELTHGKYKTWEEAARDIKSKSHNKLSVSLWTGKFDGAQPVYEDRPIDAGNALYIYAVNKMNDGRMKLTAMNITDQKVRDLANQVKEMFGQELLDVVDWVQREFFSELRNRYNPTHEALFGAPMDAIENYFPLRINASARQKDEDITEPDDDTSRLLAGTSTGAIKRRKRNSLPLDVRNADFFQEVIRHVAQMERWNAFAQWTRDSNILFSDIDFRNKIKNMDTIYGKGDKLYTYMKKAFQTAVGVYKPQSDIFSEMTLNLAKGVTSAKINFRVFTALKQLASFPAFFTYMTESGFVKSYMSSWVHPHDTMKWAKANLPSFEKRVSKRDMGDMRLMQRSTDWEWNKRMLELSQKYGMYFNVLFDTLTCATGAKAVYESRLAEYKKKGYSTAVAESRARQDAEQAFNTSQQSSEGAYMAPVQMDRNIITAALTVFRTSPIQYTRNCFYHARNLIRKRGKGTKESMINFRIGQYIADGLTEEQARQSAEKDYNKSVARDIVGMVVYGALLGILWRMVGSLPYLVAGDDDDEKKKILKKAVTGGAIVQPVTGLLGGGIVESAIDGYGNIADMFSPELPFTQDLKKAFDNIGNDKYAEAASQALSVMMQSATGFDPNTVADMITRTVTTLDSDAKLDAAQQAWQISGAVLSIPQSQYEQIMLDDLVKAGKGIDMSNTYGKWKFEPMYDKYLSDFTTNREVRTAPLTWYLRSDEQAQKAEASAERRFRKMLKERGLTDLPDTKQKRDKKKRK